MHYCYCMLLLHAFFALLYFYNVSSYSAIQPQVCNKLSVQCSKSCQLMCKIRRWHRIWEESSLFQSVCVRVQVSEPYSNAGRMHVEYMRIFVGMLRLLWLQTQSSLFIELAASLIRRMYSVTKVQRTKWRHQFSSFQQWHEDTYNGNQKLTRKCYGTPVCSIAPQYKLHRWGYR